MWGQRQCIAAFIIVCGTGACVNAQCGNASWLEGPTLSARSGTAMVFDSARQRLVLFGGALVGGSLSSATIESDGTTWQTVSTTGVSARSGHAMAFDASRGVTVLFGGLLSGGLSGSTYENNGSWHTVTTPSAPAAREGHAMAYDPVRHVIVLCGGRTSGGVVDDTWEYNGVWTLRSSSGAQRWGHTMAYDSATSRMLMTGGQTSTTASPDYAGGTWAWNGAAWTLVGDGPGDAIGGSMAYVPARQRAVFFGGRSGSGASSTLLEFDGTAWVPLSAAGGPAPRSAMAMAYDTAHARLTLAAGAGITGLFGDSWSLAAQTGGFSFTTLPQPQSHSAGQTAQFHAAVSGGFAQWRWRRDMQPLSDDLRISGVTSDTLTVTGLVSTDAGMIDVEATGPCGTIRTTAVSLAVTGGCGTADFNNDGDTGTDGDIEAFFACLAGNCCATCLTADFNDDGDTGTDADIEAFFRVLGGGTC